MATKHTTLVDLAEMAGEWKGALQAPLQSKTTPVPAFQASLRKAHRLGLPLHEFVFSLVASAPLDPLGILGALRHVGAWVFEAKTYSCVCVLDREGAKVRAAMRLDLVTDDLFFLVVEGEEYRVTRSIQGADFEAWLQEPGITEQVILGRIKDGIDAAVVAGRMG